MFEPNLYIFPIESTRVKASHPKDLKIAEARFKTKAAVQRFLTTRFLLRKALFPFIGEKAWKDELLLTDKGKPFFTNTKWNFSLSHSENWLLIGIAYHSMIGVDIEKEREDISPLDLAPEIMHLDELQMFKNIPKSAQKSAFFRLWVKKESYLKMLGVGFLQDPTSFVIDKEKGFYQKTWRPFANFQAALTFRRH